uniref:Uncharacterized protein n=1 Tax=Acrobeloides nanus TaxID=290746 RepID=A0A914BXY7_9BILA
MPSSNDNIIYEDEYCKLTKTTITIKWYYFPTTQGKNVKLEDIKGLYYKEQVCCGDPCKLKGWGMSLTPCWWASDITRGLRTTDRHNVVLEVKGNTYYCGFSVENIKDFLAVIRVLLKSECCVQHGLPF